MYNLYEYNTKLKLNRLLMQNGKYTLNPVMTYEQVLDFEFYNKFCEHIITKVKKISWGLLSNNIQHWEDVKSRDDFHIAVCLDCQRTQYNITAVRVIENQLKEKEGNK